MSKLAQDINSVGAELSEGRLAQDINSVGAELVQEATVLTLTAPANGEADVPLNATFSWTDSQSRGLYRLVYDTDSNFVSPTVVWTESLSHDATLTSGTYYWKVEAHNTVQQDAIFSVLEEKDSIAGDIEALQSMRDNLDGDNWNTTWPATITTDNYNSLHGVTLWDSGVHAGRVRAIKLDGDPTYDEFNDTTIRGNDSTGGNNLTGQLTNIPIRFMDKCQYFNVKSNNLTGDLPDVLFRKESLIKRVILCGFYKERDISERNRYNAFSTGAPRSQITNKFSGEFKNSLWTKNLRLLQIEGGSGAYSDDPDPDEGITGVITSEILDSKDSIVGVFISENNLRKTNGQDVLPDLPQGTTFDNLWWFNCEDHKNVGSRVDNFGDIPQWINSPNVVSTRFGSTGAQGALPDFTPVTDARRIRYERTRINGPFPNELFNDPDRNQGLVDIAFSGITQPFGNFNFTTAIDEISTTWNTESVLIIEYCYFPDGTTLPNWIRGLSPQQFSFAVNNMSGNVENGWNTRKNNYRFFDLPGNRFTGTLPRVKFSYQEAVKRTLFRFNLSSNMFTGGIPEEHLTMRYSDRDIDYRVNDNSLSQLSTWLGKNYIPAYEIGNSIDGSLQWSFDGNTSPEVTISSSDTTQQVIDNIIDVINTSDFPLKAEQVGDVGISFFQLVSDATKKGLNVTLSGTASSMLSNRSNALMSFNNISIRNNKFVWSEILKVYDDFVENIPSYSIFPQKDIGVPTPIEFIVGDDITLDFAEFTHPDNSYQWQKDGVNISGATSRQYQITNVQESDEGLYKLVVTNSNVANEQINSVEIPVNLTQTE